MTKTGPIDVKHVIWAFSELFFSFLILLVNAYICLCTYRIINFNCIIYLNICLIVLSSLNSLYACTKFLCLLHFQFTMLNLLKHMLNPLIILNCSYLLNTLSILRKKKKYPLNQIIFPNLIISGLSKLNLIISGLSK